jgi:hypothetical protein
LLGQYKESKDQHVPSILDWVRSAIDAGLDSNLMNTLNFIDLQAMVIEFRIREKEAELQRLNNDKRSKSGNTFRPATAEDINRL